MTRDGTLHESLPTSQDGSSPPSSDDRRPMAVGFVDAADGANDGDRKTETVALPDVAAYMADMLRELRQLAAKTGMDTLGRVLEIAETEANASRKRTG